MRTTTFAGVDSVSDLIQFPDLSTQDLELVFSGAAKGVLVGRMHNLPYFLDFENAINPHIFVCGITGSGKTYLMKNLMLKLNKILGSKVLLLDFTGEYAEFVELAGESQVDAAVFEEQLGRGAAGITYINLKRCGSEKARVTAAEEILGRLSEKMRAGDTRGDRVFVMLDEAWKLLGTSKALQMLLREGRKYGYGLIFSSQLIEDIDIAMLSNAATLFVFRLQNKQGLIKLASNYGLSLKRVEIIQKLGVGSCVAMQMRTSGKRDFCVIERVHGMEIDEVVRFRVGVEMQMEITKKKFEEVMDSVCGREIVTIALGVAERNGYIDLSALIELLMENRVPRRKTLSALRKLGIDEGTIADSFAVAVSSMASK